jgi:hypothetical protein
LGGATASSGTITALAGAGVGVGPRSAEDAPLLGLLNASRVNCCFSPARTERDVRERQDRHRAGRGSRDGGEHHQELHADSSSLGREPSVTTRAVCGRRRAYVRQSSPSHSCESVAGEHVERVITPRGCAALDRGGARERLLGADSERGHHVGRLHR